MKIAILSGVLLTSILACFVLASPAEAPRLEMASEKYIAAERSTTPEEREQLFNESLTIYLSYAKEHPSGMLLNNIGNIYFYLGDFGLAISYYRRAAVLMPRDSVIQKNLHLVLDRAGVASLQQERPLSDALGFRWCSPLERVALGMGAIAMTLVFFSLNLWLRSFGFSWLWRISAIVTVAFLGACAWYDLVVPQQAVVVKAAPLRASSDAPFTEPAVTTVRPGETVEVLGTDASRHWIRVRTASKATGYLPGQDLCFVTVQGA